MQSIGAKILESRGAAWTKCKETLALRCQYTPARRSAAYPVLESSPAVSQLAL